MKGTIVKCMEELVTKKFGAPKWKETLKRSGISETRFFTTTEDVPDADVLALMKGLASIASMSMDEVMEAFGEHWSTVYAPEVYSVYFAQAKNARELLGRLEHIHNMVTSSMKNAKPPHFRYEWKSDKELVMHYSSSRGMVALMPGLVRGIGKYFREKLSVKVVGNAVHVQFS